LLVLGASVHEARAQALQDRPYLNYYQGDMTIRRLYQGSREIGSTIWLRRGLDKNKAKYFAAGQVYPRYTAFNEQIILVCAGAFTSGPTAGQSLPEGLTVDNGRIVNRDRDAKMDGLVIVYATGGIGVSDIGKDYLSIEDNGTTRRLDLLQSADKTVFLNWAQRVQATVFQTQLLASSGGLRLNVPKAHKELRERRFLAIVRDNRTNEVIHVIIDVPIPFYLGELAQLVFQYLQTQTTVIALLNLDTEITTFFKLAIQPVVS
jgi:hypothetical protein